MLSHLTTFALHADETAEITRLTDDSRMAERGALFAALRGEKHDGNRYIPEAVARGAVCVLCETPPPLPCPHVLVPDARYALALLAAAWYGEPAKRLVTVGVTGTNGKTTTTWLLKQLLEKTRGAKVGLIGTNQNMIGDTVLPASRTTPDSLSLQALLARMAAEGCTHAVMEVSSHALVQHRAAGIVFDTAVFTNLTQDHLDYHGSMENYCDAKALLFRQCRAAAVNGDSRWTKRLLSGSDCPVTTFGQNLNNDVVGWRARYRADRVEFTLSDEREHLQTYVPVPGTFSLYNALAALAAARTLGVPLPEAAEALKTCSGVRGRCEVVSAEEDFTVIIDYAHTPDGLKNILEAVCGFAENRVLLVFGCGGDRDRMKRHRMGRIAAALADEVILTSDNPRTETPYAILHDVLEGMRGSRTPFAVLEDRRQAIGYALSRAGRGDVVLLAGKGHETTQIVGTESRALDERAIVREYLKRRRKSCYDHDECIGLSGGLRGLGKRGEDSDSLAAPPEGGTGDP